MYLYKNASNTDLIDKAPDKKEQKISQSSWSKIKSSEIFLFSFLIKILRVGVFGTFIGHGINAILIKPNWIPLITTFGFSSDFARLIMPIIGVADILVAVCVILYPKNFVFLWAAIWAFTTALSRPISGEPIIEFIERASNWCAPLVVYIYLSRKQK